MAPLFVVDYEELTRIAIAFDREADRLRQTLHRVQRSVAVLQGGDWIGQGASAFYREMSSDVLPAMKRLPSALEAAGRTTRDIAQNTKDAEDEIVRLFAGLFGLGSAAVGAAAGMDFAFFGGHASPGGGGGSTGPTRSFDDMLDVLDPKVRDFLRGKDAAGNDRLYAPQMLGWTLTKGGKLTADAKTKTITIDPHSEPEDQLHLMARALAESNSGDPVSPQTMNRAKYIRAATERQVQVDAKRLWTEMDWLSEAQGSGISFAPDFPPGTMAADQAKYGDVHQDLSRGRDHAFGRLSGMVRAARGSDYRTRFGRQWDEARSGR